MSNNQADPRDALLLLLQFGRDYLVTLSAQPATQRACEVAINDAARRVDQALVDAAFSMAQLAELTKASAPPTITEGQPDAPA